MGYFLSNAQKHNGQIFEHNRPELIEHHCYPYQQPASAGCTYRLAIIPINYAGYKNIKHNAGIMSQLRCSDFQYCSYCSYIWYKILAGEYLGKFGKTSIICQYFTQLNSRFTKVANVSERQLFPRQNCEMIDSPKFYPTRIFCI